MDTVVAVLVIPVLIHVEMELSCRIKPLDVMMVILLMGMDAQVHAKSRLASIVHTIMQQFQIQFVRA